MARWLGRRRASCAQGVLGVELRSDGVALAHVVGPEEAPRLAACDFRPCTDPADPAELGNALAAAVREHGFAGARCRAVLSPHRYGLRMLDAPEVEAEELGAAARWLVKDLIEFPLEEAVVDHIQIPEKPGRRDRIYVVTARSQAVQEVADAAEAAGLVLEVVDVGELALRNLAARLPEDARGLALLRLGPRGGVVTMSQAGHLYLARGVETGLESLGSFGGFGSLGEAAGFAGETGLGEENEAFDLLVLELQRSLDFYESQIGEAPIGHLVVAPLEQSVPGLLPYLEKNLSVSVGALEMGALFAGDAAGAPGEETLHARCLLAVGAALRREASP